MTLSENVVLCVNGTFQEGGLTPRHDYAWPIPVPVVARLWHIPAVKLAAFDACFGQKGRGVGGGVFGQNVDCL